MHHFNLEKSDTNRNIYWVRAGTSTLLLANAENLVFTRARIRLPWSATARLQPSIKSPFVSNRDIEVPRSTVFSSDKNLVVTMLNHGPVDKWIKENEIIAEVCLSPEETEWKLVRREPDFMDVALFTSICESLRQTLSRKRREALPIIRSNERPTEDWHIALFQELEMPQAYKDAYNGAIDGVPVQLNRNTVVDDTNDDHRDSPPRRAKGSYFFTPRLLF
jgi:hypothetical protein